MTSTFPRYTHQADQAKNPTGENPTLIRWEDGVYPMRVHRGWLRGHVCYTPYITVHGRDIILTDRDLEGDDHRRAA